MTLWAVIPVRSIANGKSRLAPVMSRPRRQILNRTLLVRTLRAVAAVVEARRIVVVSRCPMTQDIARRHGAVVLREPLGADLNRAIEIGRDYAAGRGCSRLLILPCDLPLVTSAGLSGFVRQGVRRDTVAICSDRHGVGTNALFLRRPARFTFRFGGRSAVAHGLEAKKIGQAVVWKKVPSIEFDLDTPDDYRDLYQYASRLRDRNSRQHTFASQME